MWTSSTGSPQAIWRLVGALVVLAVFLTGCLEGPHVAGPLVTQTVPRDGESGVVRDVILAATIEIAGSPIDPETVDGSTVRLASVGSAKTVGGSVDLGAGGESIAFRPTVLLQPNTEYIFTLSDGIRDENGRQLRARIVRFETGAGVDGEGPHVASSVPAADSADVDPDVTVTVEIDPGEAELDASSVDISTVYLASPSAGSTVHAGLTTSGNTISLYPFDPLEYDTEYVLTLEGEIRNERGYHLDRVQIRFTTKPQDRPSIKSSTPEDGDTDVFRDNSIRTILDLLPQQNQDESAGVEGATVTPSTVMLRRVSDNQPVEGGRTVSGGRDSIIFTPDLPLESNTEYEFEITEDVEDIAGRAFLPFRMRFTTGADVEVQPEDVDFEKTQVYGGSPVASIAIGPDDRLYATTLDGQILRWTIGASGSLSGLQSYELGERALIGIAFDPDDPEVLWVSHNDPLPDTEAGEVAADFTGAVARVSLDGPLLSDSSHDDVIVGLPRSAIDHMTNSLAFGPDGALYLNQGSNTSNGAADDAWANRPERLLSGAVLRIDTDLLLAGDLPLDVQTESYEGASGNYDPDGEDAAVTIFATGLRNAYDLLWVGSDLYVPVNGGNGGNTPGSPDESVPALEGVDSQRDFLHRVREGLYYGHPNPLRDEYVLNGGNPTAGDDGPDEVAPSGSFDGYPVGIEPHDGYDGHITALERNDSANGIIQYQNGTFGNALLDKLLIVRYSAGQDIIAVDLTNGPGDTGYSRVISGLEWPVDLIEHIDTGNIYVAENTWGRVGRIQLLEVAEVE